MISLDFECAVCSHVLSCSLTSTPRPICILSPICHKRLEKSEFDEDWKVASLETSGERKIHWCYKKFRVRKSMVRIVQSADGRNLACFTFHGILSSIRYILARVGTIYVGDIYVIYIQYFRARKYLIFSVFSKLDIFHIFSTSFYYLM